MDTKAINLEALLEDETELATLVLKAVDKFRGEVGDFLYNHPEVEGRLAQYRELQDTADDEARNALLILAATLA